MSVTEFNRILGQRIRELIPVQTVWAVCKSVDWENKTMVATGQTDDLDYEEVSLGRGWEAKKPKVGAICLLGMLENNAATAYLIDAEELDELYIRSGDSEFTVKREGFIIKHGDESLKQVLDDLMDEKNKLNQQVQAIVVSAGVSPNVPALQQIETNTTQVKQRLNTILIE